MKLRHVCAACERGQCHECTGYLNGCAAPSPVRGGSPKMLLDSRVCRCECSAYRLERPRGLHVCEHSRK